MFDILQVVENKGVDQNLPPIAPKPIERWSYGSYFKEYLLLLATRGPIALESLRMYPERIELGETWHQTLNHMRKSTWRDGIEKWAFAGVKAEKRGIFLPTVPVMGSRHFVPSEAMKRMKDWARNKPGIVDFLGDIHSHPTGLITNLEHKIPFKNKHKLVAEFSAGDFYAFLVEPNSYFMGIVTGGYNTFTFKARESTGLGVDPLGFSQESFEKYWYEKFGFKYLGGPLKFGANRTTPISDDANSLKMNFAIAEKHRLLIYQGKANKELIKIFSH